MKMQYFYQEGGVRRVRPMLDLPLWHVGETGAHWDISHIFAYCDLEKHAFMIEW